MAHGKLDRPAGKKEAAAKGRIAKSVASLVSKLKSKKLTAGKGLAQAKAKKATTKTGKPLDQHSPPALKEASAATAGEKKEEHPVAKPTPRTLSKRLSLKSGTSKSKLELHQEPLIKGRSKTQILGKASKISARQAQKAAKPAAKHSAARSPILAEHSPVQSKG